MVANPPFFLQEQRRTDTLQPPMWDESLAVCRREKPKGISAVEQLFKNFCSWSSHGLSAPGLFCRDDTGWARPYQQGYQPHPWTGYWAGSPGQLCAPWGGSTRGAWKEDPTQLLAHPGTGPAERMKAAIPHCQSSCTSFGFGVPQKPQLLKARDLGRILCKGSYPGSCAKVGEQPICFKTRLARWVVYLIKLHYYIY